MDADATSAASDTCVCEIGVHGIGFVGRGFDRAPRATEQIEFPRGVEARRVEIDGAASVRSAAARALIAVREEQRVGRTHAASAVSGTLKRRACLARENIVE